MKIYKPKIKLKTSQQVAEFAKGKVDRFIMPYKGGTAVVIFGIVKEVYVGPDNLVKAKNSNLFPKNKKVIKKKFAKPIRVKFYTEKNKKLKK